MSGDFCVDIEDFIRDDVILESTEYFSIHIILISPCGGIVGIAYATVNITDDDGKIIWPCIHIMSYMFLLFATELKAGFTQQVDLMLEEGNGQEICVRVEGPTERPIDDIAVNGKL